MRRWPREGLPHRARQDLRAGRSLPRHMNRMLRYALTLAHTAIGYVRIGGDRTVVGVRPWKRDGLRCLACGRRYECCDASPAPRRWTWRGRCASWNTPRGGPCARSTTYSSSRSRGPGTGPASLVASRAGRRAARPAPSWGLRAWSSTPPAISRHGHPGPGRAGDATQDQGDQGQQLRTRQEPRGTRQRPTRRDRVAEEGRVAAVQGLHAVLGATVVSSRSAAKSR